MSNAKKLASTIALITLCNTVVAEPEEQGGVTLTPMLGYYTYSDGFDVDDHSVFGGALGYQFANGFELGVNYITGSSEFADSAMDVDAEQTYLTGIVHFKHTQPSHPFLLVGAGQQTYSAGSADFKDSIGIAGAGYQVSLSPSFSLRPALQAIYNFDERATTTAAMLGFSWKLGATKPAPKPVEPPKPVLMDSDGDGVVDSKDQCPNTMAGDPVDGNGCKVNMDLDNDGVPNDKDKCPDTSDSAKVDADGCYIVITESKEIQLYVAFDGGSATVAASSYEEVRKVADFMKEYPLTRVILAGHTDSSGSESFNQKLSLKRAQAVAELLGSYFGVTMDRIETVGYGESQPLYPNDTPENRAKNRRVTATVSALVKSIQK